MNLCGHVYFQVKQACPAELTRYAMCMEKSGHGKLRFSNCRQTGEDYNACMKEKMGMETPHFGYHALVKVHQSDRCVRKHNVLMPRYCVDCNNLFSLLSSSLHSSRDSKKITGKIGHVLSYLNTYVQ